MIPDLNLGPKTSLRLIPTHQDSGPQLGYADASLLISEKLNQFPAEENLLQISQLPYQKSSLSIDWGKKKGLSLI